MCVYVRDISFVIISWTPFLHLLGKPNIFGWFAEFVQVFSPTHLKMRVWERGAGLFSEQKGNLHLTNNLMY